MAKPINRIQAFRNRINNLLSAIEAAQAEATTIDYLGGLSFYRDELQKVDGQGVPIYDITPGNFTSAVDSLNAIRTLLEANNQAHGKALARMRD